MKLVKMRKLIIQTMEGCQEMTSEMIKIKIIINTEDQIHSKDQTQSQDGTGWNWGTDGRDQEEENQYQRYFIFRVSREEVKAQKRRESEVAG